VTLLGRTVWFEAGSCYVVQAGLEFTILLPWLLKCWDYRDVPPYLDLGNLCFPNFRILETFVELECPLAWVPEWPLLTYDGHATETRNKLLFLTH
jgi:hypothetical protein